MRHLPSMPANTCPDIDQVLEMCEAIWKANHHAQGLLDGTDRLMEEALGTIEGFLDATNYKDILEELREANDALRKNAEHWESEADDLRDKCEGLEKKVGELQDEIKEIGERHETP